MACGVAERFFVNKPSKSFPRQLSVFLKPCLGAAFAQQGFAAGEIVTRWAEIVGAEFAAHSEPVKLQWPRRDVEEPEPATLILRAEGPAAIEIQHAAPIIIERVNRFFGWAAVKRIAIRQAPLGRRKVARRAASLDPAAVEQMEKSLPDMQDEGLRSALSRLGAAIKQA